MPFSPLEDAALPEGTSGLYLGGGYPELYVRELSENVSMREAIRKAVAEGLPTIAECGGFLYLHRELSGEDGVPFPMAGVFDAAAANTHRLSRFGYVTLTAQSDGLLGPAGFALPAHESTTGTATPPAPPSTPRSPSPAVAGTAPGTPKPCTPGSPHFHLWAAPEAARRFVEACQSFPQH